MEKPFNGLERYQMGKQFKLDSVITEILANRSSGFELSQTIAARSEFSASVIFYSSLYRDLEAPNEVVAKYSAQCYFAKPVELKDLTQAIAALFNKTATGDSALAKFRESPSLPSREGKGTRQNFTGLDLKERTKTSVSYPPCTAAPK